jgi:uncharacterized protein with GYD domain
MPTYIALGTFAEKGISNIKDSPTRVNDARVAIKKMGGELKSFYYTMGRYDFATIAEFPNNETAMTFLLALGNLGNVKTETLVAIPVDQAAELIKKIP